MFTLRFISEGENVFLSILVRQFYFKTEKKEQEEKTKKKKFSSGIKIYIILGKLTSKIYENHEGKEKSFKKVVHFLLSDFVKNN